MINANDIDFNEVYEKSIETLRLSNDHTKTILKFSGDTPSFLEGLTVFSYVEIKNKINDPNNGWIGNE